MASSSYRTITIGSMDCWIELSLPLLGNGQSLLECELPGFQAFFFFFFFFLFFRAALVAYGVAQPRGQIGAASSLCHSHSNAGSKLCLQPTPQLMAMLDH